MEAKQFAELLKSPLLVEQLPVDVLRDLAARYPFSASLQMLLLKQYQLKEHPAYDEQLAKAAVYAPDRRALYRLVQIKPVAETKAYDYFQPTPERIAQEEEQLVSEYEETVSDTDTVADEIVPAITETEVVTEQAWEAPVTSETFTEVEEQYAPEPEIVREAVIPEAESEEADAIVIEAADEPQPWEAPILVEEPTEGEGAIVLEPSQEEAPAVLISAEEEEILPEAENHEYQLATHTPAEPLVVETEEPTYDFLPVIPIEHLQEAILHEEEPVVTQPEFVETEIAANATEEGPQIEAAVAEIIEEPQTTIEAETAPQEDEPVVEPEIEIVKEPLQPEEVAQVEPVVQTVPPEQPKKEPAYQPRYNQKDSFNGWLHRLKRHEVPTIGSTAPTTDDAQVTTDLDALYEAGSYEASLVKASGELETPVPSIKAAPPKEELYVADENANRLMDEQAKKSLKRGDELVTETLAKIYEIQGKHAKAIEAYEILKLRHPHKAADYDRKLEQLRGI